MTKTENYQLPQWAPHDPVRRTDFNAAMGSIDTALQAANDAVAAAASTAFSQSNLPYEFGSFNVPSGSDTEVSLVTFPFRPSAILFMNGTSLSMYNRKFSICRLKINSSGTEVITVYLNGNTLKIQSRSSTSSGQAYYMAFR